MVNILIDNTGKHFDNEAHREIRSFGTFYVTVLCNSNVDVPLDELYQYFRELNFSNDDETIDDKIDVDCHYRPCRKHSNIRFRNRRNRT